MGMPITLMTLSNTRAMGIFEDIFEFFERVDQRYSPYIGTSDVQKINRRELDEGDYSEELNLIIKLAESTKKDTNGYFDVWHEGVFDPSGIVKGWALQTASDMMSKHTNDFYIEAGGDIQVHGYNDQHQPWRIGIRNPFERKENIEVISLDNHAVATSGTAIRGQHIYDPVLSKDLKDIVSLTVIAPKILDADRMATAAFAMASHGIEFIESLSGYEGFMVNSDKRVTKTTGWDRFGASTV